MSSRTSQFTSTPPSSSVTCASSEHLRPLGDDPARRAEWLGDVAAEQFAEPERAGEHHRREHLGAAIAAEVAQHRQPGIGWNGRRRYAWRPAPRGPAPRASVAPIRSMSSSSDEVKSPTRRVDVGMQGLAAEQRHVQQEARGARPAGHVCAKTAANIIAGVTPRARACANSASRVCGSNHCQRRVLRFAPRPPVDGKAGGSGLRGRCPGRAAEGAYHRVDRDSCDASWSRFCVDARGAHALPSALCAAVRTSKTNPRRIRYALEHLYRDQEPDWVVDTIPAILGWPSGPVGTPRQSYGFALEYVSAQGGRSERIELALSWDVDALVTRDPSLRAHVARMRSGRTAQREHVVQLAAEGLRAGRRLRPFARPTGHGDAQGRET